MKNNFWDGVDKSEIEILKNLTGASVKEMEECAGAKIPLKALVDSKQVVQVLKVFGVVVVVVVVVGGIVSWFRSRKATNEV